LGAIPSWAQGHAETTPRGATLLGANSPGLPRVPEDATGRAQRAVPPGTILPHLLRKERAKVPSRDKALSLVRIYLVDSELVGDQFSILSNEVAALSCLCVYSWSDTWL